MRALSMWIGSGLVLVVAFGMPTARAAGIGRGPDPITRIELDSIGYEGLQSEYLAAGSPMLSVAFVDDKHLLVTFEVHRLMKRELDAAPGEQDRMVAACVVEISSGKVLARTEWRLHDRAQYLWNLGNGRFLLRIRDQLLVFAPMVGKPEEAFQTSPFLLTNRRIVAVVLSSDRDLLTVESVKRPDAVAGDVAVNVGVEPSPVQINFYRIKRDEIGRLLAAPAGAIRSRVAVALPITSTGYLDILEGGKSTWYFNFDEHAGKVTELLAFDTTCFPRPVFVGQSEFVVFGCKGTDERRIFAGFNLRGEEMWQQGFYEPYVAPTFAFAPAAGRFALGRTIVALPMPDNAELSSAAVTAQDVRVYQMHTGRQLFRIDCTPVERAGENFDLSPDGLRLAVIREAQLRRKGDESASLNTSRSAGIEIYALPPVTEQDRSDVKAAEIAAPRDTDAPIDQALARVARSRRPDERKGAMDHVPPAEPASEPTASAPGAVAAQNSIAGSDSGEPPPAVAPAKEESPEPRKPPTLYGPDEKPEHK